MNLLALLDPAAWPSDHPQPFWRRVAVLAAFTLHPDIGKEALRTVLSRQPDRVLLPRDKPHD